ncbi:MAG: alpha-E domain-containing protein [Actinomycetota bacterium]
MALLLSRTAERLYWAARYLERAEDTSRMVLAFGELFDDLPPARSGILGDGRWTALLAVFGNGVTEHDTLSENDVAQRLIVDPDRPGSVASSVGLARENLRTTRELLPRAAWRAVNDLSLFVNDEVGRAADRRFRGRVLRRVVDDSRRLDGILTSSMTRDDAWEVWRLGRYLERADMTTRVVGVRAAALMAQDPDEIAYDEVHGMGVLRSLSALQMYQRATRGPIEASQVVKFLLFSDDFPRSVLFCLSEIDRCLERLTDPEPVRHAVVEARSALLSTMAVADDGADLDDAMDWVQSLLAKVHHATTDRYLSIGG